MVSRSFLMKGAGTGEDRRRRLGSARSACEQVEQTVDDGVHVSRSPSWHVRSCTPFTSRRLRGSGGANYIKGRDVTPDESVAVRSLLDGVKEIDSKLAKVKAGQDLLAELVKAGRLADGDFSSAGTGSKSRQRRRSCAHVVADHPPLRPGARRRFGTWRPMMDSSTSFRGGIGQVQRTQTTWMRQCPRDSPSNEKTTVVAARSHGGKCH